MRSYMIHDSRSMIHDQRGFTLLELLLVIAVSVLLGTLALRELNLGGSARAQVLDGARQQAISELTLARDRALRGEDERKWGIHFVNGTDDYYELFSTPTNYADMDTTVREVTYLPNGVTLTDPAESGTLDIIFNGISGTTT